VVQGSEVTVSPSELVLVGVGTVLLYFARIHGQLIFWRLLAWVVSLFYKVQPYPDAHVFMPHVVLQIVVGLALLLTRNPDVLAGGALILAVLRGRYYFRSRNRQGLLRVLSGAFVVILTVAYAVLLGMKVYTIGGIPVWGIAALMAAHDLRSLETYITAPETIEEEHHDTFMVYGSYLCYHLGALACLLAG
jgi:hypothetical protein